MFARHDEQLEGQALHMPVTFTVLRGQAFKHYKEEVEFALRPGKNLRYPAEHLKHSLFEQVSQPVLQGMHV